MGSEIVAGRSISSGASARAIFITRVYLHLLGAILVFVAFEVALFKSGVAERLARAMAGVPWGLILAAFLLIAWFASRMAWRLGSPLGQYGGLGLYIVGKGLIFVPLLFRANRWAPGTIEQAAQVTVLGVLGLTLVAWMSRNDFSFLRPFLYWGGIIALILIVTSLVFGWHLGTWFSVGMIALSGAAILYDTADIARRYHRHRGRRPMRSVGAALSLFASIGMMFWYVLRLTTRGGLSGTNNSGRTPGLRGSVPCCWSPIRCPGDPAANRCGSLPFVPVPLRAWVGLSQPPAGGC